MIVQPALPPQSPENATSGDNALPTIGSPALTGDEDTEARLSWDFSRGECVYPPFSQENLDLRCSDWDLLGISWEGVRIARPYQFLQVLFPHGQADSVRAALPQFIPILAVAVFVFKLSTFTLDYHLTQCGGAQQWKRKAAHLVPEPAPCLLTIVGFMGT
jgi:hypothetical protein